MKSSASLGNGTCVEAAYVSSSFCADSACVQAAYVRSSLCGGGTCVEAASTGGTVLVRDSKDLSIAPLAFPRAAWHDFLDGIASGEIRP